MGRVEAPSEMGAARRDVSVSERPEFVDTEPV